MKTMAAGVFKTKCLTVMDEVAKKREPVLITKKGKPVAQLVPVDSKDDPLADFYFGKIKVLGDIVSPIVPLEDWDALNDPCRYACGGVAFGRTEEIVASCIVYHCRGAGEWRWNCGLRCNVMGACDAGSTAANRPSGLVGGFSAACGREFCSAAGKREDCCTGDAVRGVLSA